MSQHPESRSIMLRLKVFEGQLFRNVSRYGSMSPYIEATWNNEIWTSKIAKDHHNSPEWEDYHLFNSTEAAPLIMKVFDYSILFKSQEIGFSIVSVDELYKGIAKGWIDVYHEGKVVGKVKITVNMHEEKKSEQSTLNTSYANIDLKEEYLRKCNELELEKEELEFYRRKYKKKKQKLSQDISNYKNVLKGCVKKTRTQMTEECDFETLHHSQSSEKSIFKSYADNSLNPLIHSSMNQYSLDLDYLKNNWPESFEKKLMKNPAAKSDNFQNLVFEQSKNLQKCVSTTSSDFNEFDKQKSDTLELRFETFNQFSTPQRSVSSSSKEILESISKGFLH